MNHWQAFKAHIHRAETHNHNFYLWRKREKGAKICDHIKNDYHYHICICMPAFYGNHPVLEKTHFMNGYTIVFFFSTVIIITKFFWCSIRNVVCKLVRKRDDNGTYPHQTTSSLSFHIIIIIFRWQKGSPFFYRTVIIKMFFCLVSLKEWIHFLLVSSSHLEDHNGPEVCAGGHVTKK